jgi:hypothetical protein
MIKFLLMAFVDVVIKSVISRGIKKALPKIFANIDSVLPCVIDQKATPEQVRQVFKDAVTYETDIIPVEQEIEALIRMYDPSIAQKVRMGFDMVKDVSGLLK